MKELYTQLTTKFVEIKEGHQRELEDLKNGQQMQIEQHVKNLGSTYETQLKTNMDQMNSEQLKTHLELQSDIAKKIVEITKQ